jgi:hypothetical protein
MAAEESTVLFCRPLGHECRCTRWAMRRLADQLARTGVHVLRFDYFATGDSAGATGDDNVKRWHDDIRANESACLRLVSAVLMEISEDWQTADKRYVVFDEESAIKR